MTASNLLVTPPPCLIRKPFDLGKLSNEEWTIIEWIGRREGNILDPSKITCKNYLLEGEFQINGEELLGRIKSNTADIQMDVEDFMALNTEKEQKTLRWLFDEKGIYWMAFWGNILKDSHNNRFVIYLYRCEGGRWFWKENYLARLDWCARYPSGIIAS